MYSEIVTIRPSDAPLESALEFLRLARMTIQGVECEKADGVWRVIDSPADPAPSADALRAARRIVSTINLDTGRHLNENAVISIAKIIDREMSLSEEEMTRMYEIAKNGGV